MGADRRIASIALTYEKKIAGPPTAVSLFGG
jgi:hypothetical protein